MRHRLPLTAFLLAALAGASSALAQPVWVEKESAPPRARDTEQRRIEVRVQARDDDEADDMEDSAKDDDDRPQRRRVVREQRVLRDGTSPSGQPRGMILDDDQPRQARRSAKRQARAFRTSPDAEAQVEVRIEGPDGPMQWTDREDDAGPRVFRRQLRAGPAGPAPRDGRHREVIILRDDDHERPGRGGPQVHRFDVPGGQGRIMILRDGDGGRWTPQPGGPQIRLRGPGDRRGQPRVHRFEFDGDEGQIMLFRHGPDAGPRGDVFFRGTPDGPDAERDVIIRRRGGGDDQPRVQLRRMGNPAPGSGRCPDCNCI